ncbi:hypothetical protein BH09MYX1_BH09MYX1_03660 [soil metagenome]
MRDLVPCSSCRRLHRLADTSCPFCFAVRIIAFAAVLPLAIACHDPKTDPAPIASASTAPSASVAASTSPSADPSAIAALTPSAVASIKQAVIGRDAGADPLLLGSLGIDAGAGLAGLGLTGISAIGGYGAPPHGTLTPGLGAYGIPPTGSVAAPFKGQVTLAPGAGAVGGDERALATCRGGVRGCYIAGLATNPAMNGKLTLSLSVNADGKAHATKTGGAGLSPAAEVCIERRTELATFEATAHTLEVNLTFTPE